MTTSSQAVYELTHGILTIQANERKDNDLNEVEVFFSFTRYSDGKIFEYQLDDPSIQKLHRIFFDTSLILDILDRPPLSMEFGKNTDENIPGDIQDKDNELEFVAATWEFKVNMTKQDAKKYPILIQIPEKEYSPEANQAIKLNRLLNHYKQRITDLESRWTTFYILDNYIPAENYLHQLTIDDMQWLAFSNYGAMTGLNKYFTQFKIGNCMVGQLLNYNEDDEEVDVSIQHINDWLLKNNFNFDKTQAAQFHLNKYMETNELELIDVRLQGDKDIARIDMQSGLMHIVSRSLYGYCVRSNPLKPKQYIILRSKDPAPKQYEKAFYLRDAYQPIKKYAQTFQAISKIEDEFEERITYNSQFVIYKFCMNTTETK